MEPALEGVKALAFDVFGTVVDYRTTIVAEGGRLGEEKGLELDWAAFADAWRGRYRPSMDRVMRDELPWRNLDALHRAALNELLEEFGVRGLSEVEKDRLNGVWHRLLPWGDSVPGMLRLRTRFVLATLSNGNVRLLVDMAKNAGLPWDLVFSAEVARAYKPDPRVYRMLQDLLMLSPDEIMLVAAHQDDLRAARDLGFRTAFVMRPLEHGPQAVPDRRPLLRYGRHRPRRPGPPARGLARGSGAASRTRYPPCRGLCGTRAPILYAAHIWNAQVRG